MRLHKRKMNQKKKMDKEETFGYGFYFEMHSYDCDTGLKPRKIVLKKIVFIILQVIIFIFLKHF